MTYSTHSSDLGNITFTAPAAGDSRYGYVWIETAGGKRQQICDGGDFTGSTLSATTASLKATAQRWLRQRRRWRKAMGV
jgi:hypothetical protein